MLLVGRVAHEKNIGFLLRRARRGAPQRAERTVRRSPAKALRCRGCGATAAADGLAGQRAVRRLSRPARRAARLLSRRRRVRVRVAHRDARPRAAREPRARRARRLDRRARHEGSAARRGRRTRRRRGRRGIRGRSRQGLDAGALQASLGSAGRDFVAHHWSSLEMARRLLRLYEEVVTASVGDRRHVALADQSP